MGFTFCGSKKFGRMRLKSERKAFFAFLRLKMTAPPMPVALDVKICETRDLFCYGFIDSGKYFDGAQTLTVKLLQPRMRNSRMMRI